MTPEPGIKGAMQCRVPGLGVPSPPSEISLKIALDMKSIPKGATTASHQAPSTHTGRRASRPGPAPAGGQKRLGAAWAGAS